jgi:CubicO group peptidase (beta-lactamase class C family)
MIRAAVLALMGVPALVAALAASPALADPFDGVLAAHPDFSGAVLVEKDGAIAFDKAYGLADEKRGIPNRTSTSFHIGALSMLFTDLATQALVDDRKLSLDNTAGQFLPGLAPAARDLRVRDMIGGRDAARHILLARIDAAATGKPFADRAGAVLFASVWQSGTGWDDGSLGADSRYAKGYDAAGHLVTPDWAAVLGADGVFTTTRDLLRWADRHLPAPAPGQDGARVGGDALALDGEGNGFAAAVRLLRDSHVTVIVLCNHAGTPVDGIAAALAGMAAKGTP